MARENKEKCLDLGHQPKSPRKAIREYCVSCCNDSYSETEKCTAKNCQLWGFRMSQNVVKSNDKIYKPTAKVIKQYCLSCAENYPEVVSCIHTDCKLWPFRLGKSPWRERQLSEEKKQQLAERLKKIRENKGN